jgi:hypothetical protein
MAKAQQAAALGHAMVFPVTVRLSCDPSPVSDGVIHYNFFLDGHAVGQQPAPLALVAVPVPGLHVFAVSASSATATSPRTRVTKRITRSGAIQ